MSQRRDVSPKRSTRLIAQRQKLRLKELCRALPEKLDESSRRALAGVLDECQGVLQGIVLPDPEVERLLGTLDQYLERMKRRMSDELQIVPVSKDQDLESLARQLNPLCHDCFGYAWVIHSFLNDLLFLAKLDNEIVGFMTLGQRTYENDIEINLLCAKGGFGGRLLDWFIAAAKSEGIRRIHLHALPENVNFYRKKGFQLSDECQESPEAKAALDLMINRKGDCSKPDEEWKNFIDEWDDSGVYFMTLCL